MHFCLPTGPAFDSWTRFIIQAIQVVQVCCCRPVQGWHSVSGRFTNPAEHIDLEVYQSPDQP